MKTINFKFQGNIENDVAICNISDITKFSKNFNQMFIPAELCSEFENNTILIDKKVFNKALKNNLITFK